MAEEIGFENGRNSNFQGFVTLTLTLDPAIGHTVVHQSSTSTYVPNFIQIEETFCGRTDGRTDGHFSPSNIIRSTFASRPKNDKINHVYRHADSRYFCSPLFGTPSLGALGSCHSRLPLDLPLLRVSYGWATGIPAGRVG